MIPSRPFTEDMNRLVDRFSNEWIQLIRALWRFYVNKWPIPDLKSEEITTLKVTIANLEALLDKKEEICQSQALKISDLSDENAILKQKASDSMEKLMKLQASHFDLTNVLNNKTELCNELSEKVNDLTYKINTFRKTSCVM